MKRNEIPLSICKSLNQDNQEKEYRCTQIDLLNFIIIDFIDFNKDRFEIQITVVAQGGIKFFFLKNIKNFKYL